MTWRSATRFFLFLGLTEASIQFPTFDPLDYVKPIIGSAGGGHAFAGATLPYGMAKAVADTNSGDNQGGFVSGDPSVAVTGFSSMHDSGTGGQPSLGNFALFPYSNCSGGVPSGCKFPKKSRAIGYVNNSVVAEPGYFAIQLNSGVQVEMTTTQHTALYKFNFSSTQPSNPLILIDLTDLSDSRQDNGTITVDAKNKTIKGSATFLPSFGQGQYQSYFCTQFNNAAVFDSGIFVNTKADSSQYTLTISRGINGYPLPGGAWLRFTELKDNFVTARVGISYISVEQACKNGENEIPNFDFKTVRSDAKAAWARKLEGLQVSKDGSPREDYVQAFYSGIYRTMISPQNYTGENPLWSSTEPYFDSFYCIWDLFRSQLPFLTLIDTSAVADMVRSLIDTYVHDGWLPDCRMSLNRGYTQGGSNADVVLADAFVKGVQQGINWPLAYEAVKKDAEVEPYDWCCRGRGGLDSWHNLNYIPYQDLDYKGFGTMTRSISRTLEYSYNDFAVYQIGKDLNQSSPRSCGSKPCKAGQQDYSPSTYKQRSGNWLHLFKKNQTSYLQNGTDTTFTGFFQPRNVDGSWSFQDPLWCSQLDNNPSHACSLQNTALETFESSIWEYSFFVPHDQASLIQKFGGDNEFVRRLDYLHDSGIIDIGNEPAFLTVFQYHYAGRPGLSAKRVHFYIPNFFNATELGLPGNDDSGAMGSFMAFCMMGLFPNPGQNVYLITPPFFKTITIKNPITQNTAKIVVENYDPGYGNLYIQNATVDGLTYTKNWLDHSFFTSGRTLRLFLGPKESETWGTQQSDRPPSLSPYKSNSDNSTVARKMSSTNSVRRHGLPL